MIPSPAPGGRGLKESVSVREGKQLISTQQTLGIVEWFASL